MGLTDLGKQRNADSEESRVAHHHGPAVSVSTHYEAQTRIRSIQLLLFQTNVIQIHQTLLRILFDLSLWCVLKFHSHGLGVNWKISLHF